MVERCLLLLRSALRTASAGLGEGGLPTPTMTLPHELREGIVRRLRDGLMQSLLPPRWVSERYCHVFCGGGDPLLGFPSQLAYEAFPHETRCLLPLLQEVYEEVAMPLRVLKSGGDQLDAGGLTMLYLKRTSGPQAEGQEDLVSSRALVAPLLPSSIGLRA